MRSVEIGSGQALHYMCNRFEQMQHVTHLFVSLDRADVGYICKQHFPKLQYLCAPRCHVHMSPSSTDILSVHLREMTARLSIVNSLPFTRMLHQVCPNLELVTDSRQTQNRFTVASTTIIVEDDVTPSYVSWYLPQSETAAVFQTKSHLIRAPKNHISAFSRARKTFELLRDAADSIKQRSRGDSSVGTLGEIDSTSTEKWLEINRHPTGAGMMHDFFLKVYPTWLYTLHSEGLPLIQQNLPGLHAILCDEASSIDLGMELMNPEWDTHRSFFSFLVVPKWPDPQACLAELERMYKQRFGEYSYLESVRVLMQLKLGTRVSLGDLAELCASKMSGDNSRFYILTFEVCTAFGFVRHGGRFDERD